MKELDLLVENYFTPALDATDILRLVEQIMEEDSEGQSGTAFEDVIVDVARRGFKKEVRNAKGKITQYATGGKKGSKKYNPDGKKTFKGQTFTRLAITCLKLMGYTEKQIKSGVDPKARKASGAGVSGDPKTDIIIDGKQISLKLPGDIQLSSGAAASTNATISAAFEVWAKLPQVEGAIRDIEVEVLRDELEELKNAMDSTTGKRYYPHEKASRGDWRKYVDDWEEEFGVSYEAQLAARAQGDWEKNKYPSGGIPANWKYKYELDANGKVKTKQTKGGKSKPVTKEAGPKDSQRLSDKGTPIPLFPTMRNYIDEFIKLAKEKMKRKPELVWQPQHSYEVYEEFKNNALKGIKNSLKNLASRSATFYYILVDEWLTGRRAQTGEQVAHYLLSPWSFDEIKTEEQTKKVAEAWKANVKLDMRGKAREFLGKEMAVRIDFKADKYYKKKLADFYKKLKFTNFTSRQAPYLNEEDGEETNSEEEFIQNLAKEMAKSLVIEI
jgi:hypothetical protein